ncbi:hypothetical protein BU24DRAFT_129812 [Aaosphaeria arxii CBS 175.79]|uniref:Uncharacterized protein n=1 Tax=Aaosphaeria arxii CBS 175.79 TaxID=1450172 RepID=A0A6A5Y506_9PLEO|nr:uncharacterized protein BU24DRAFT_129812 [Aaosphaeria arxii CBS 175.79]KAF2019931.1 hypothetical protein BU24DRAFT_129812 [Aaosphaeria arxii CBS 175.79]
MIFLRPLGEHFYRASSSTIVHIILTHPPSAFSQEKIKIGKYSAAIRWEFRGCILCAREGNANRGHSSISDKLRTSLEVLTLWPPRLRRYMKHPNGPGAGFRWTVWTCALTCVDLRNPTLNQRKPTQICSALVRCSFVPLSSLESRVSAPSFDRMSNGH